jgi:TPP-dependent indolepyruvate ferredoxin oxidoreductase alpha subunit
MNDLGCPAILADSEGNVSINWEHCLGCGYCVQVCPFDAILQEGST